MTGRIDCPGQRLNSGDADHRAIKTDEVQKLDLLAGEGDLRLSGVTSVFNWDIGHLEVFYEGSWGQVCAAGFMGADAVVACRQLGYTAAGAAMPSLSKHIWQFAVSRVVHGRISLRVGAVCMELCMSATHVASSTVLGARRTLMDTLEVSRLLH